MNAPQSFPCPRCIKHPGWEHDDESRRHDPADYCRACYGSGVRHLSKGRPNANPILARMRDDFGDSDDWGTAISWAFGVAEILHAADQDVPDELEFSPSPFVAIANPDEQPEEYPDSDVWAMLHGDEATIADLQFAGRCLARYLDWLRAAGKDY